MKKNAMTAHWEEELLFGDVEWIEGEAHVVYVWVFPANVGSPSILPIYISFGLRFGGITPDKKKITPDSEHD